MPTLNIQGVGSVQVGPEFLKLSPEDQHKTVDEIAGSIQGKSPAAPTAQASPAAAPSGLLQPGNIDLESRPIVHNSDGSFSTIKSMSIGQDGKEVLIPMVSPSGTMLTEQGAIALYQHTGKHLGIFDSPQSADAYAQSLHEQQAKLYGPDMPGKRIGGAFDAAAPMADRQLSSAPSAGLHGFAQGATLGFGDEIGAALDLNPSDIGDISGAYSRNLERRRLRDAVRESEHPVASTAGQIAGAVATIPLMPEVKPFQAAGLLARAGNTAATGAAYGALSGAGSGEGIEGKLAGAALGGAGGAAIGGVMSPVVDTGAALAPYLRKALPMGMANSKTEAAKRIAGALVTDSGGDVQLARQNVAQIPRLASAGMPAVIADAGGETTRNLARAAGNISPQADEVIRSTMRDRFTTQGGRAEDFIRGMIGNFDNTDALQSLQDAARRSNKPAYAKAFTEGDKPLWSPELQRLVSSPAVVAAMRTAATKGKDRAVTGGFGGFRSSVQVDPSGIVTFTRDSTGAPVYPNLQYWDAVKRALDDETGAAKRAGRKEEASTLSGLATQMRSALDAQVPSYANARSGAAQFFGAQDALEAGKTFATSRMSNTEARKAIQKMTVAERQLFAAGYASQLMKAVRESGDNANILNSQFVKSPAARERIYLALGSRNARALETHLRVEGIMDQMRAAMGNSTTAKQLMGIAAFGAVGGGYGYVTGQSPSMTALIAAGARFGKIKVDQRVAEEVGRMLMSDDPQILEKGLKAVASNQALLQSIRNAQELLSRGAASVAGSKMSPRNRQPLKVELNAGERDRQMNMQPVGGDASFDSPLRFPAPPSRTVVEAMPPGTHFIFPGTDTPFMRETQ